jgi:hypothetical protein
MRQKQKADAGDHQHRPSISLTVIAAPGCTVIYFYTENFLVQILSR